MKGLFKALWKQIKFSLETEHLEEIASNFVLLFGFSHLAALEATRTCGAGAGALVSQELLLQ